MTEKQKTAYIKELRREALQTPNPDTFQQTLGISTTNENGAPEEPR